MTSGIPKSNDEIAVSHGPHPTNYKTQGFWQAVNSRHSVALALPTITGPLARRLRVAPRLTAAQAAKPATVTAAPGTEPSLGSSLKPIFHSQTMSNSHMFDPKCHWNPLESIGTSSQSEKMIEHVHAEKIGNPMRTPSPPTSQPAPLDPPVTLRRTVLASCARVVTVGVAPGLMTVKAGAKAMATHKARRTLRAERGLSCLELGGRSGSHDLEVYIIRYIIV